MKRNLYLKTKPVEEALAEYMEALEAAEALKPQIDAPTRNIMSTDTKN